MCELFWECLQGKALFPTTAARADLTERESERMFSRPAPPTTAACTHTLTWDASVKLRGYRSLGTFSIHRAPRSQPAHRDRTGSRRVTPSCLKGKTEGSALRRYTSAAPRLITGS
uniref:Uncharacterized protein n=1 Tax=Knipowitschia caucasica TaxID=637954 RepID=A0AAV2JFZ9_KNICA